VVGVMPMAPKRPCKQEKKSSGSGRQMELYKLSTQPQQGWQGEGGGGDTDGAKEETLRTSSGAGKQMEPEGLSLQTQRAQQLTHICALHCECGCHCLQTSGSAACANPALT
jgi:hypothetical protein